MSAARAGWWILFAAALAAAVVLRLWDLAGRPLWLDESWSRWMSGQSWMELWPAARRYDTHPPFYYSLLKLWQGLAPPTPIGLRALSLLAGLAMLPLGWLCARRVVPQQAWLAPLVAAALAASPALIAASRQARPYALLALAFALALWAALALLRGGRPRWPCWLAYLTGLELVLWLHGLGPLFAAALAAGLLAALALQRRLRGEIVPFLAVHAAAALAWLPGLEIILEQRQAWTRTWLLFSWSEVLPGLGAGLVLPAVPAGPGLSGLAAGLGARAIAALPVALLALLGAGALLRRREDRPVAVLLLAAALAPAAMTLLVSAISSPVFLPRTLVPSVLPLLLLAGAGIAALAGAPARAAASAALLGLLAAGAAAQLRLPPEEPWAIIAAWLDRRVGPREEVWLLPNELILPLRYGAGGALDYPARGIPAEFPAPGHPGPRYTGTVAVPGMAPGDAANLVEDARRRGVEGVWLVGRFPHWFDPQGSLGAAFGVPPDERLGPYGPLVIEHYRLARERRIRVLILPPG